VNFLTSSFAGHNKRQKKPPETVTISRPCTSLSLLGSEVM